MEYIGCGECCLSEKCEASKIAFGVTDAICPALRLVNPGYHRGMLVEFETITGLNPLINKSLGIGLGCSNETKIRFQLSGISG